MTFKRNDINIKIFGAGVGGLTTAHILSQYFNNIEIYEIKNSAGGLARTVGPHCDTREISWRVYFHFYKNLFKILKEIKSYDGKTVYDHLVPYENIYIPQRESPYNFKQKLKVAKLLLSSDQRLDDYDNVSWYDYTDGEADAIPQWLGMDRYKGSTTSVVRVGIEQSVLAKKNLIGYVLDGPTSDILFNPWVDQLIDRGVKFHFGIGVTDVIINPSNESVEKVYLTNGQSVTADKYIFGLPVEVMVKVFRNTPDKNMQKLAEKAYQIQLAFQMHLAKPLSFGQQNGKQILSVLLQNSPWGLIIEAKNISWKLNKDEKDCKLAQWSVTACQANVPGIVYGKSLINCTESEAQNEILAQILEEDKMIQFLKQNNPDFDGDLRVVRWGTMSETYKLLGQNNFYTTEPKFSNNVGTKILRPSVILGPNAFITTGYCKETLDIFSMEAATISGQIVANLIMDSNFKQSDMQKMLPNRVWPILTPFRFIDRILFSLGLPDIISVIITVTVVIIFVFFIIQIVDKAN